MCARLIEFENSRARRPSLSVEGNGSSRLLLLHQAPVTAFVSANPDAVSTLGRFHGKIKVTAHKNRIFSSIRERIDGMEKRLGVRLKFEIEGSRGKEAGELVTLTCYVYEPLDMRKSEFERHKVD
ncbi:MAG: hypothetical protein V1861_04710 [Candidatus Micrarchaeota archaeon]